LIASHEKNVNMEKVMKMVMMHDISESRAGDVDYLARQYVQRNEELGIKDMLAGTAIEKEYLDLWQEYEDRKTLEAKIAKDADNLDVDFELAEQLSTGRVIHKQWVENRTFVSKNRLFTDTAKAMFKQIQAADPHRWHTEGRNRRTMGDWKK
jgi:putative hydrolase of HD superfamily